jgi:hypothetical protein
MLVLWADASGFAVNTMLVRKDFEAVIEWFLA